MRVAVTGATGNVGSQLIPQLLDHPAVTSVVGLARRLPDAPDPRAEWHALDVAEDDLVQAFRGADVVVHLAWLLQPAHDPALGVLGLELVEHPLGLRLVPAVRRAADAAGGVALLHPRALRPGGVGPDRGGVHEHRHAGRRDRGQHA